MADKEGRLEDRPKRIKAELLPFDAQDVEPLLRDLHNRGFIYRYKVAGIGYIQILKFKEHQSPHYSEKSSVIPPPVFPECSTIMDGEFRETEPDIQPEFSGNIPEHSWNEPGLKEGSQPPSSLTAFSLNPSSLNPEEKAKSGKPRHVGLNGFADQAREILNFLNAKTGRHYQVVDANIKIIAARLKEGATPDDCRAVIANRCRKWRGDPMMDEYLRPKTLFSATNFAQYRGELNDAGA